MDGRHNNWNNQSNCGWNNNSNYNNAAMHEALYAERKECKDYLDLTREHYQGRLINQAELASAFFDAWKRDADNSFALYKSQRDGFDITNQKLTDASFGLYKSQRDGLDAVSQKMIDASFGLYKNQRDGFDILNQKMIDSSFGLYKNQRDTKDEINMSIGKTNQRMTDIAFDLYKNERDNKDILVHKINELQNKVDVLTAVRPYQDALINAKIDKNEIISDFKLAKRTARMIEGRLVLPNEEITGFTSNNYSINV